MKCVCLLLAVAMALTVLSGPATAMPEPYQLADPSPAAGPYATADPHYPYGGYGYDHYRYGHHSYYGGYGHRHYYF